VPLRGTVYVLSKSVKARSASSRRPLVVEAANIVVVSVRGRVLEIRKEDPSDNPCGEEAPARGGKLETYLVDVEEFYDADRHLQLQPAYVKGC
jgi:hypothetical protein